MNEPIFDGSDYQHEFDFFRLTGQIERVRNFMNDGNWHTLSEISTITKDPHASVSAQLRNLRKERFGHYVIEKRRRGTRLSGFFEYRLAGRVKILPSLIYAT